MFQNQFITPGGSWEAHLQMAEEIQKNLPGKPQQTEAEAAPPNGRVPFWKSLFGSRQARQPAYPGCSSEPCGDVRLG